MARMPATPHDFDRPPGGSRPPGGRANDYDTFAAAYSADNEVNLSNAHYERPAILALAGTVTGRRILDAGCGSGSLTEALRDRGAEVTGTDSSASMLALAARRLGGTATLVKADLGRPLPFATGSFDDVMASLVLHYLPDWGPVLAEFHRVLVPGGRLVASTHHPFMDHELSGGANYFATYNITEEWTKRGQTAVMSFWHRPLHAMTDAFTAAGFDIGVISEPQPVPAARDLFPPTDITLFTTQPRFLFFVLSAH
jgi:ubiquinone/menaquinone biosynthesis C-methylase UbiE